MTRLFIDLASLIQWYGPPVGIARCQERFALHARRNIPGTVFTVYDPRIDRPRPIREEFVDGILAGTTKLYMGFLPVPGSARSHTIDRVPERLRPLYWWVTRFRRKLVLEIESHRLAAETPDARARWTRVQEALLTPKLRPMFDGTAGGRVDVPDIDDLLLPPVELGPGDITLAIQSDWTHTDVAALLAQRDRSGSRYVALCHDVIPLMFPQWYSQNDVRSFRRHFEQVFARADRILFTSRRAAEDALSWCAQNGIACAEHRCVPLGADPLPATPPAGLPPPLEAGRYAVYVSTVEPRKNHAMLVEAWRGLVRDGTVARARFKLVFVGRKGWMMGDFFDRIAADPGLSGSVIHLQGIGDDLLAALYRDTAFCLYPSIYEGYGLPPIEALARGKAVIASTGGPIPELVGDFAVCLDPHDTAAWETRMRDWMTGSDEPARLAGRALRDYRAVTWDESARALFEAALSAGRGSGRPAG